MKPNNRMNLNIMNSAILLVIGIVTASHAAAQETLKLPPSPLQLLGDKTASRKADLKLADLENILRNHKAEIFSADLDRKKFSLLLELCQKLKEIPEGKELQPLLLKEISAQKVIERPPVGWDEILVSGHGGSVGLLMECVIAISGEMGFNQIFHSVVEAKNPVKLKILLLQIAIRRERANYDPILVAKLESLELPQLKEVIEAHLTAAATEK